MYLASNISVSAVRFAAMTFLIHLSQGPFAMFPRRIVPICCCLVLFGMSTSAPASVTWLDFAGWDHNVITTTGQTFTNIVPGVDVTVTGTANPFFASAMDAQLNVRTGVKANAQQFSFSFSSPLPLVVDVQSLDRLENLTVTTGGPVTYSHSAGALPSLAGSLSLTGNGVAFGPNGCARGQLDLGTVAGFTWDYSAQVNHLKYEWFRVGTSQVPEPGCLSVLIMVAGAAAFARRRVV